MYAFFMSNAYTPKASQQIKTENYTCNIITVTNSRAQNESRPKLEFIRAHKKKNSPIGREGSRGDDLETN